MTDLGGVRMYFGTASGSARLALEKMEEPHIMLSVQSKAATPWEGIGDLFLDSGGYSLMLSEGEHDPVADYLDQVESYGADRFALPDYPCEPEILDSYGRSVRGHQRRTTVAAAHCTVRAEERGIDAEPLAALQGWETHDYLEHLDSLRDEGLLTDRIGIGSICRRNQTDEIREIIKAVRRALPSKHDLHAFGVKNEILSDPDTRDALASADTTAWYFRNYDARTEVDETWQEMVSQYLNYRRRLADLTGELHEPKAGQATLGGHTSDTDRASERLSGSEDAEIDLETPYNEQV